MISKPIKLENSKNFRRTNHVWQKFWVVFKTGEKTTSKSKYAKNLFRVSPLTTNKKILFYFLHRVFSWVFSDVDIAKQKVVPANNGNICS